jgi:hypothetical protein
MFEAQPLTSLSRYEIFFSKFTLLILNGLITIGNAMFKVTTFLFHCKINRLVFFHVSTDNT